MHNALIVGGGISGLSTAYYLKKAGIACTVVEKSTPGGLIQTRHLDGCLLEAGPDSFLSTKPEARDLIRELNLHSDLIGSNDAQRVTYIVRHGKLVPLPDGMLLMAPTRIWPVLKSPLLSWRTKLSMARDWVRRRAPKHDEKKDRSVSEFLHAHYGQEAIDYLAEPLLAGVYGGDPAQLSANSVLPRFVDAEAKHGSLSRGLRKDAKPQEAQSIFQTLRGGLGHLVDATAKHASIVAGTAEAIERVSGLWRIKVNGDWMQARWLVLACSAYEAGALLTPLEWQLASALVAIPYSSSVTLSLVFDRQSLNVTPRGFGFLVPKVERRRLVAATWTGNKFAGRVPADRAVLRCFMGEPALHESDEALVEMARMELRELLGLTSAPLSSSIARWPRSMPQYLVGHAERLKEIQARAAVLENLHIVGNAYTGIGIPDCIRTGKEAAQNIESRKNIG